MTSLISPGSIFTSSLLQAEKKVGTVPEDGGHGEVGPVLVPGHPPGLGDNLIVVLRLTAGPRPKQEQRSESA